MKTCTFHITGTAPYSAGRGYQHEVEKLAKEAHDEYEKRTWRERLNYTELGYVFIPPTAFKNALSSVAKYLGKKIPGKRNATYTKHFEAGLFVMDRVVLGIKKDDVPGVWRFVPSDGVRGSGKRVMKCFPTITEWEANVTVHIVDDTITPEILREHMEEAGKFIGVGVFRPQNNGFFGRWKVDNMEVSES